MTTTDPRYAAWIRKVDAALELRCGLALDEPARPDRPRRSLRGRDHTD